MNVRALFLDSPKLVLAARVALGAIFIAASADKLIHPKAFAEVIVNYRLLPGLLVNPAAVILPWLELIVGLALVFGPGARGAGLLALLLMSAFAGALGFNLARGLDVACGCFRASASSSPATLLTLGRDVLFLMLSLFVFLGLKRSYQPPGKRLEKGT